MCPLILLLCSKSSTFITFYGFCFFNPQAVQVYKWKWLYLLDYNNIIYQKNFKRKQMKKNTFGMKISLTSEKWNETLIILNNNLSYSEVFYWQQLKKTKLFLPCVYHGTSIQGRGSQCPVLYQEINLCIPKRLKKSACVWQSMQTHPKNKSWRTVRLLSIYPNNKLLLLFLQQNVYQCSWNKRSMTSLRICDQQRRIFSCKNIIFNLDLEQLHSFTP